LAYNAPSKIFKLPVVEMDTVTAVIASADDAASVNSASSTIQINYFNVRTTVSFPCCCMNSRNF